MAHAAGHPGTGRGVPGRAAGLAGLGRRARRPASRAELGARPDRAAADGRRRGRGAGRARAAVRALGVHLAADGAGPGPALAAQPGLPGARRGRLVGAPRRPGVAARYGARPAARSLEGRDLDRAGGAGQHDPAGRHARPVARRYRRSPGRAARGGADQPGPVRPFRPVPPHPRRRRAGRRGNMEYARSVTCGGRARRGRRAGPERREPGCRGPPWRRSAPPRRSRCPGSSDQPAAGWRRSRTRPP
jgi:hypothetical protein